MTERTRSPHARPADGRRAPAETADEDEVAAVSLDRFGWSDVPGRLRIALPLSVLGAALLVVGPGLGLVGGQPPAGFAGMPLLVILAVLPPLLAAVGVWSGRPVHAAGVLIGSALLAPGRALTDLQFAQDALVAARPELMVPTSLAPLPAASGLWVLIAGHVVIAVAGLLAAGTVGAGSGPAFAETEDIDETAGSGPVRRALVGVALTCSTAAGVTLLWPPFRSGDAFLLAKDVIAGPALARTGGLLLVAAVVLGGLVAASSRRPALTRGMTLGLLAATAAVTVPQIAGGLAVNRLGPAPGPYLALAAMAVLALAVFVLPRLLDRGAEQDRAGARTDDFPSAAGRLHLAAGVLGILAGIAALAGGLGGLLVVDAGLEQPASYANRQLVPAGVLVVLLAAGLPFGRWAAAVRPAFTMSLAGVLMVGAAALDTGFTATGASTAVHAGPGLWFTGIAMIIAIAAAACAILAGGAEREDVDLTERATNLAVAAPVAAAALLAVGAFGLPAVRAPGFVPPGIWSDFRLASWGLLLGLLVVLAAAVLGPVSRPARAAALLLGAAAVVGVRLLEYPLTAGRAEQATAGAGTWLSLGCLAALVIAALIAGTTRPSQSQR